MSINSSKHHLSPVVLLLLALAYCGAYGGSTIELGPARMGAGGQAPSETGRDAVSPAPEAPDPVMLAVQEQLRHALPGVPPDRIAWLAWEYGNTAVNIAEEHGRSGAEAILALGQQGVAVMREHPDTFAKIALRLDGETAAIFLAFMSRHFQELASLGGLPTFLDRIEALQPKSKSLGRKHPQMLPFLALAETDVFPALRDYPDLCLIGFTPIDLRRGPNGIARVARMISRHGHRARPWVKTRGLDGLLLADEFPAFLDRHPPMDLPVFLQILSRNQADIAELVAADKQERLWIALEQLARQDDLLSRQPDRPGGPRRGDWLALASVDGRTVRLLVDRGSEAFRVLAAVWPRTIATGVTLPSLLYDSYDRKEDHPKLPDRAWQAVRERLGKEGETFDMLLLMAQRAGQHPATIHPRSDRFWRLLARLDHRVVPFLIEAEREPQLAESRYFQLEERGLDLLDSWESPPSMAVETVPFYDTAHLGWVLAHGYTPTPGEILFAGIDVAFAVCDIVTLGGGKLVCTPIKVGVRTMGKKALQQGVRRITNEMAEGATQTKVEDALERASTRLFARLTRSPKVAREVAKKRLSRNIAVSGANATQSARRRRIPLVLLRYTIREWAINMAMYKSLMEVAEYASSAENEVWAEKTKEVLLFLNGWTTTGVGSESVARSP